MGRIPGISLSGGEVVSWQFLCWSGMWLIFGCERGGSSATWQQTDLDIFICPCYLSDLV